MNVPRLKLFCRRFAGATETQYPHPENFLAYAVGGRAFAYFKTSEPERWRFSVRVLPEQFIALTGMPGVKPARYRGRYHWITIVDVSTFPADYLRELVAASYRRALLSLSRSRQVAITSLQPPLVTRRSARSP